MTDSKTPSDDDIKTYLENFFDSYRQINILYFSFELSESRVEKILADDKVKMLAIDIITNVGIESDAFKQNIKILADANKKKPVAIFAGYESDKIDEKLIASLKTATPYVYIEKGSRPVTTTSGMGAGIGRMMEHAIAMGLMVGLIEKDKMPGVLHENGSWLSHEKYWTYFPQIMENVLKGRYNA